ncbi:Protein of unknown function [Paraoerskovia marina]|uniref:DUF1648 domain-containing protein n=1 Tax=Paraoerskovia marina TaxID=545619 RepID=A0A1H1U872_9CELL|nr:DUF1648 domain-containing protein [Paraoerskovia marina]SDS68573.1 Protein of unknown function [Paraoerskovia marina]
MTHRTTSTFRRPVPVAVATGVLGLLALGICAAVSFTWIDDLPEQVAVHWGPEGADRFASPTSAILGPLALGAVLTLGFAVMTALVGQSSSTRRISGGLTVGMPVFMGVLTVSTIWAQQAVDEPSTSDISQLAMGAVGAGLLTGVLVAVALPGDEARPATAEVAADAPRLTLPDDTRAVWVQHAQGGPGLTVGLVAAASIIVLAILTELWFMLLLALVLGLALVAMMAWVVRVDASGLHVRSVAGFPRTHVPADEVERAGVVEVAPMREFGGWGWRVGRGGRVGVVVRNGEGLLVERSGGRSIVVTVDDAATGAALLNTMSDRARGTR